MIVVTGASGFVGCHLCRVLEESGQSYLALVRSPRKAVERGIPAERTLQGDLTGSLPRMPGGVQHVVHLAGLLHALRAADMRRVNTEGTERVLAWMREQAPGARLVHVSSLAAAGPSADGRQSACSPANAAPVSRYGESKLAAEQAVERAGLPFVGLRPGIVYGPWDTDVLALFKTCARGFGVLSGPPSRYSLVHVDDLVAAILACLEHRDVHGAWLPIAHPQALGDADWLRCIGAAVQRRVRILRLPLVAAAATAGLGELWGRLRRSPPVFGRDKYREMRAGAWLCDPEPARAQLGFEARIGHDEGHRQTAAWYRERGWL